jgi:hypothetical protein
MRILMTIVGLVALGLGGLWLLQGLDMVHLNPILCVADCKPIVGGSGVWAGIGAVTAAAGVAVLIFSRRMRRA